MIDCFLAYVADNFGNRPSVNEGERAELEYLRQAVSKLRDEVYGAGRALSPGTSTGESEKVSSASESGDDEDDSNTLFGINIDVS